MGLAKDVLGKNVSAAANPPAPLKQEMRVWDIESRSKFFQGIEKHKYSDLLRFTMATGLRRGEVCGLKWEYVDFIDHRCLVQYNMIPGDNKMSYNSLYILIH